MFLETTSSAKLAATRMSPQWITSQLSTLSKKTKKTKTLQNKPSCKSLYSTICDTKCGFLWLSVRTFTVGHIFPLFFPCTSGSLCLFCCCRFRPFSCSLHSGQQACQTPKVHSSGQKPSGINATRAQVWRLARNSRSHAAVFITRQQHTGLWNSCTTWRWADVLGKWSQRQSLLCHCGGQFPRHHLELTSWPDVLKYVPDCCHRLVI